MLKNLLASFLFIALITSSCSNQSQPNTPAIQPTVKPVIIEPKNYLDFEYDKVIAFATVDPFDYTKFYYEKEPDFAKFGDTLSKTLTKNQIELLNDYLSGRNRNDKQSEIVLDAAEGDCFYPRHNIIFLKDSKVIHYISVCFECYKTKCSKPTLATMDNYAAFFNSIGLKVFDRPDYYAAYYDSLKTLKHAKK